MLAFILVGVGLQKAFVSVAKRFDNYFSCHAWYKLQAHDYSNRNLLAIAAGIKQKDNVDSIVRKV